MTWFERTAENYLPYVGHIKPHIVLLADGSLLSMIRLRGLAHELSAIEERRANANNVLNNIYMSIGQDNVTLGTHFIRRKQFRDFEKPRFTNEFSEALDHFYRENVLGDKLFVNEWFISIIVSPINPFSGTGFGRELQQRIAWFRKKDEVTVSSNDRLMSQMEGTLAQLTKSLSGYYAQYLGVRWNGRGWFSEIGETLKLLITTVPSPVPIVNNIPNDYKPLGAAIYSDRVIFGHYFTHLLRYVIGNVGGCPRWAYEIQTPVGSKFGTILGLRQYMPETDVGILDDLLNLPFSLVVTQSFGFLSKSMAIAKLNLKQNQMRSSGDVAASQINALPMAKNRLMNGEFDMGNHHISIAGYADTLAELDANIGMIRSRVAESTAVAVPETLGMEAAYWAQLPGNGTNWRPRPAIVSTVNLAHLADFPSYPIGNKEGHWGRYAIRFKTTAGTSYDYVPHVDDVGMTAIFGRTGSGKSVLMNMLCAGMFDQYLVDNDGIVFSYDKDLGGKPVALAVGGRHIVVRSGVSSGLNPLRGFKNNTPYAQACLSRWVRGLIEYDDHGPIKPIDEKWIARGVVAQLRLPVEKRSLLGLRLFLGWYDSMGAGPRLERWCRGGPLGWAFDGDEDLIDYEGPYRYFEHDLTDILDTPEIIEPAAQYLRDRQRPFIDGRRVIMKWDECQAYILTKRFRDTVIDDLATLRKNNGIVFLATQQPENFLSDEKFGAVLLGQCHTLVFFPTPMADVNLYRGLLKFTEGELDALTRQMLPGSRRFLLKRQGEHAESAIIDFDLSDIPEFVPVLSGTKNRVRLVERLRGEVGDDWLAKYMTNKTYEEARD
jgi:type IV secretion system protein VirB4